MSTHKDPPVVVTDAAERNAERCTLNDDQAELAVEALRKTFLFDGWHYVPTQDRPILAATLYALGDIEVYDEMALDLFEAEQ